MTPETALSTGPRGAGTAREARVALALGMTGALGDELLAALLSSPAYRLVHVALNQPITSAAAKYHPWIPGSAPIAADDAWVCVTDPDAPLPRSAPVEPIDASHILDAAHIARAAGARRLVLVSPLSALMQLNAASHTVSSEQELELVDMRFASLIIVRPTEDDLAAGGASGIGRAVRSVGRMVLEIMLPPGVQALRPRTAALAILTAVERSPAGVSVIGARELLAIVEETRPELAPKRPRIR